MAKGGISLVTGLTVAGLLGLTVFAPIMNAFGNFLSNTAGAETNQDFQQFSQALKDVCSGEKTSATGGISEYGSSISFTEDTKVVLIEGSEVQMSSNLDCPVEDYDEIELTGTVGYTVQKDGNQLVVQVRGG